MPVVSKNTARKAKKRVAAYARVSTLMEEQEESYETQRRYYEAFIRKNPDWVYSGIYADKGITGTSATKRPEFMRMIDAARKGEIDIILCKSISRFSRNVLDTQRYVHELKSIHVEVRFEKEGISSYDNSADLIFSVLATAAEMESRSISENVKWSIQKRQEAGTYRVGSNHMLGYDEIDGKLTPNQDAWIIKLIFEEYARGISIRDIIRQLNDKGAHRLRVDKPFCSGILYSILRNEAYVGDRLFQKTAPSNVLTKKPDFTVSYSSKYIYNEHEAIIDSYIWDGVCERLDREAKQRSEGVYKNANSHFLYGKIFCAECGQPYSRHTARGKDGLYKTWRCNGRIRGSGCGNRHIKETELIEEIRKALGWENGVQVANEKLDFDEWAFVEKVDRVFIVTDGVQAVTTAA